MHLSLFAAPTTEPSSFLSRQVALVSGRSRPRFSSRAEGTTNTARCRPPRMETTKRRAKVGTEAGGPISQDIPDFELVNIPGNGSCMFQAIAQGHNYLKTGELLDNIGLHREGFQLRRNICLALVENRADVEPFLAGDFESYLHHMSLDGVWGGEPELAMAVKVIERPILVYRVEKSGLFSGSQLLKSSEYGVDDYVDVPPVCILFASSHYDCLLPKISKRSKL